MSLLRKKRHGNQLLKCWFLPGIKKPLSLSLYIYIYIYIYIYLLSPWTITDADYADDIELLSNTPTHAESLLHSLKRVAGGRGLHVNADKTEYMWFNQKNDISILNSDSLKLVNNITYIGRRVSSTENDINTRLAKAWTAIDRLSVIWKSNPPNKIKRIFPSSGRDHTAIWMHLMDADLVYRK